MDYSALLDPEVASLLAASPFGSFDFGELDLSMVETMREALPLMFAAPPSNVRHRDELANGTAGSAAVPVRVYHPATTRSKRPCLYWIHGGGFMLGSPLADEAQIDRWVEALDCVAVSVDYRLAPEHPYPAPLEDCYAGLAWTISHADELGIDPSRVLIGGASAGGGLAAGLALLVRDRGEMSIAFQLLIYPMVDDRNETPSCRLASPIWPRKASLLAWRSYLGTEPGGPHVPVYAAPARAADLAGLPPAFIGVGSVDIVRDESVHYGLRLLDAGVPTEVHVYPGAPHAVELFAPTAAVAQRFQRDVEDALRRALYPTGLAASGG